MRVEYYRDADRKWRQRVVADNGKIVFPPEGYENLRDCVDITERLLGGDYAEALKNSHVTYALKEAPEFEPVGEVPPNLVPETFADPEYRAKVGLPPNPTPPEPLE